jgi:hypothetical protein
MASREGYAALYRNTVGKPIWENVCGRPIKLFPIIFYFCINPSIFASKPKYKKLRSQSSNYSIIAEAKTVKHKIKTVHRTE